MVFWISVLVGAAFAFKFRKKDIYPVWASFFNTVLSIYLATIGTAMLGKYFPEAFDGQLSKVIAFVGLWLITFLVAEFLARAFLTNTYKVTLPDKVNALGSPVLGFLMGYFLTGAVFFAISILPLNKVAALKSHFANERFYAASQRPVKLVCGIVEAASLQQNSDTLSKAVLWMQKGDFVLQTTEDEKSVNAEKK